jgi:hypothetical protein
MEYKTLSDVERAGEAAPVPVTRAERLERWAKLLEQRGSARLNTLWRTEHAVRSVRPAMRANNSPLSVAFEDPLLRVAGLADDSYGEAKRFFELSDYELHWIVCYCHFGETISAEVAAHQVRALARVRQMPAIGNWLTRMFFGRAA